MAENNATTAEDLTANQAYTQIRSRLADTDSTEVTDDELLALNVLTETHRSARVNNPVDSPAIVAKGRHDVDPVVHYLLRVDSGQFIVLKHLKKLISRNGGGKWVATRAGEASVEPTGLTDDFETDVPVAEATICEAYRDTAEGLWSQVVHEGAYGFAWDGHAAHIELEEPFRGLDEWLERGYDVDLPAHQWEVLHSDISDALPSNPRNLNATLHTEFKYTLTWEEDQ